MRNPFKSVEIGYGFYWFIKNQLRESFKEVKVTNINNQSKRLGWEGYIYCVTSRGVTVVYPGKNKDHFYPRKQTDDVFQNYSWISIGKVIQVEARQLAKPHITRRHGFWICHDRLVFGTSRRSPLGAFIEYDCLLGETV